MRTKKDTTYCVEFPASQNVWSTAEGNIHARWRDMSLFRSEQLFIPRVGEFGLAPALGEARFYIAPGETFSRNARRSFERLRASLPKSDEFPARIEFEFSSPTGGPASRSEAYRTLAIDWALSVCDTVLLCINRDPGRAKGEAHQVLAPLQVVFHCREEHVSAWRENLVPRLKPRHRFYTVHLAAGRA